MSPSEPASKALAERCVGTLRWFLPPGLLDHVIVLNERHLKRLMNEYIHYYHEDRTHLGLDKQTPAGRQSGKGERTSSNVIGIPRLGGLHHRYDLAA